MTNYLAYGAIGFGLALAVLAFRLLSKEQARAGQPRASLLKSIYVFMLFALTLSTGGFINEYLKGDASQIGALRIEIKAKDGQLNDLQKKYDKLRGDVDVSQAVMKNILDLKVGKVARLERLDPNSNEYFSIVNEIRSDLEDMDKKLSGALDMRR